MQLINPMKRVCCLYRVSRTQQVEKNDIPLQKQECHSFCENKGWVIVKELYERGVTGYKKSIYEREAIDDILAGAKQKEFDVFLVFMFDRIGRREDEVPAFASLLFAKGIEVWSTQEGEQRFDSHVDKLLFYINIWQAAGESEKIGTRIRARQSQMVSHGIYRGGAVPFGYQIVKQGRMNKYGHEVHDIIVNETEADIVRWIFHKIVDEHVSMYRLTEMLCTMEIQNTNGNARKWRAASIRAIIDNRMYIGCIKFGDDYSLPYEHLQIIPNDVFNAAQKLTHRKRHKSREIQTTQLRPRFSEILYCQHCKTHLIFTHNHEKRKSGKIVTRNIYRCYGKESFSDKCNGPATYMAHIVQQHVDDKVNELLEMLFRVPEDELISNAVERERITTLECPAPV